MFGKEKEKQPEKPPMLKKIDSQIFGGVEMVEFFILEDTETGKRYLASSAGGIVPM